MTARATRGLPAVLLLASALGWLAGCGERIADREIPSVELRGVERPIAEAVRRAREAVRRRPESAEAWAALGARYYAHDWYAESVACYRRAAALEPGKFEWEYRKGYGLFNLDDLEAAAAAFARAIEMRPAHAPAHAMLAETLARQGRDEEARPHYEEAARLDPRASYPLLGLGQLALAAGRFEQARETLEQALSRDPRHGEVHQALARVYLALGDEPRAEEHAAWTRRLPKSTPIPDPLRQPALKPAGSQALNTEGTQLVAQGRLEEGERAFREALDVHPAYTEAHYNLGTLLARQGRIGEAIEHLAEAVRIRPSYPDARVNLGLALAQAGRLDDAERELRAALEVNPDHSGAHDALGRLRTAKGDLAGALAHYRESLRVQPDSPAAARQLAWTLATARDPAVRDGAEAVRIAEAASRRAQDANPRLLDALAAAYAETGRFAEAVTAEQKAIGLAAASGRGELIDEFRTRLELYERREPFRQ